MTRTQALADLAEQNVITEARLVDAHVRPEEELRNARREAVEYRIHAAAEFAGLTA